MIYPQFATHNAYTRGRGARARARRARYEFQRLHGMGEALYEAARAEVPACRRCGCTHRSGTHEDLLPYLVRRLLENGANSSFVHQFMNPQIPVEQVVRDPVSSLSGTVGGRAARTRARRALWHGAHQLGGRGFR